MTLNEQDLDRLRRICAGDKLSEKELMDKYREPIKMYFINKRLHRADVEDLCQDVVLIILKQTQDGAIKLNKPDFRNYVFGICWNIFCEFLREKILETKVFVHSKTPFDPPEDPPPSIFEDQELQAQIEIIIRLFKSLPPLKQKVLWDYWVNKMSSQAVGLKYGMSDMAVRAMASNAKSKLHEQALAAFKKIVTILAIMTLLLQVWKK